MVAWSYCRVISVVSGWYGVKVDTPWCRSRWAAFCCRRTASVAVDGVCILHHVGELLERLPDSSWEVISLLQFRGRRAGSQLPNIVPWQTDRNFLSTFALKNAILFDDRTLHASRKIGAPWGGISFNHGIPTRFPHFPELASCSRPDEKSDSGAAWPYLTKDWPPGVLPTSVTVGCRPAGGCSKRNPPSALGATLCAGTSGVP